MQSYEKTALIKDFCDQLKRCMDTAYQLNNGGRDIPKMVNQFNSQVTVLQKMLSTGAIAEIIDAELKKIAGQDVTNLHNIDEKELKSLISQEFKHCAAFNLDRFVTTNTILRNLEEAARIADSGKAPSSSGEIAKKLAKNTTAYQNQLATTRSTSSEKRNSKKQKTSHRTIKKVKKKKLYSGIYNTLIGIGYIACNTATLQMKTSASFAHEHFKIADEHLF